MKLIKTRLPGLDWCIGGGLYHPSTVLISGVAGTGKTTIAANIAFNLARKGMKTLFVSTLSEPPAMILNYMSKFSFFEQQMVDAKKIEFVSIDFEERTRGLEYLKIIRETETKKPDVVIIDPITPLFSPDSSERGKLFNFYAQMKGWNTLTILTHEMTEDDMYRDLNSFLADTVIQLTYKISSNRKKYSMSIVKSRGNWHYNWLVDYQITSNGLRFYPIPMLMEKAEERENKLAKGLNIKEFSTGSPELDKALGGGIREGSTILVVGPPGSGKRAIGYHIISHFLKNGQKCMIFNVGQDPEKHIFSMESMNLKILDEYKKGKFILQNISKNEFSYGASRFLYQLDEILRKKKVKLVSFCDIKRIQKNYIIDEDTDEFMLHLIKVLNTNDTIGIFYLDGTYENEEDTISTWSPLFDYILVLEYPEPMLDLKTLRTLKIPGFKRGYTVYEINFGASSIKVTPFDKKERVNISPRDKAKSILHP